MHEFGLKLRVWISNIKHDNSTAAVQIEIIPHPTKWDARVNKIDNPVAQQGGRKLSNTRRADRCWMSFFARRAKNRMSGKHYSSLFLPASPLSGSQTLEGLYELPQHPSSKALSHLYAAFRPKETKGHCRVCSTGTTSAILDCSFVTKYTCFRSCKNSKHLPPWPPCSNPWYHISTN